MALYLSALAGAGWQFFDDSGNPLSGGKLYTYVAGTTTPAVTYTSISGAATNTNPIILDSAGRVPEEVWLVSSQNYKFVLKTSTDVTVWTKDQITGISGIVDISNATNVNLGDALVGFKQSNSAGLLAGAVASTVHNKLQESVSVKDFGAVGDGVTDDFAAITAALAAATSVYLPYGTYAIGTPITVPAGRYFYGPGVLKGVGGYTYNYLMLINSDSTLAIGGMDGTGMPVPTTAWTGAGSGTTRSPIGCAIFLNGSAGSEVNRITIRNVKFTNFPSGPVCTFYANFLLIEGCVANNTQTAYAVGELNGVFSINRSTNVRLVNNSAAEYHYKVFYFGNCIFGVMEDCICQTSTSVTGFDASHYVSGGYGIQISSCSSSTSFGLKITSANNVVVNGYVSLQSTSGGIIIQSSSDISINDCIIYQPTQYGIAVIAVDTEDDSRRVRINNCEVNYPTPGSTVNNVGVLLQISGGTSKVLDDISINNCVFRTPFFGVYAQQLSGGIISRVKIINCSIYQPTQYGVISYANGIEISGCLIYGKTVIATPLVACYTQPSTTGSYARVMNNRSYAVDATTQHYNIGTGGGAGNSIFATIEFVGNSAEGGNYFLRYDGTLGSSTLNTITVQNNMGYLVAAPYAIDLVMGATNTTCIMGNSLVTGAGRTGIGVTNAASVTTKVDGGATGNNIDTGQPVYI